MMRLKLLAVPALAALTFPITADAGVLLRGRLGGSKVISGPITPAAPTTATAAQLPPATPTPAPTAAGKVATGPATAAPATGAAPAPTGGCANGNCGHGFGGGGGGIGGLFERLCGGGGGCGGHGHDGHGGFGGNRPPVDNGPLCHGFGFCQPPFQAAPWYLYWPYDSHFQLPAPIGAPYYPPQQFGSQW